MARYRPALGSGPSAVVPSQELPARPLCSQFEWWALEWTGGIVVVVGGGGAVARERERDAHNGRHQHQDR